MIAEVHTPSSLFLDSASVEDARAAAAMNYVSGITTNPTLMARASATPDVQIPRLLEAFPGLVFHQPISLDPKKVMPEVMRLYERSGGRLVAKLPATPVMYPLIGWLRDEDVRVAVTGVYSPAQAVVAAAAGAEWVIPYVNRAKRLMDGGEHLITEIATTLERNDARPKVLAASVKSVTEAVSSLNDGADAVSLSLEVLAEMGSHPLTESAIEEFARSDPRG
jgi:transaldolase